MCEYSNEIEKSHKVSTPNANHIKSVQNLINKFEQLICEPPLEVRTDSKFKVRKYLSLNIMNENSDQSIPVLNQNVVNQFLQTQYSPFKPSGSVRETKSKGEREQKKRSESLRQEKNSGKYEQSKKTSDSFLNKYFRSLSDSKVSKRNGNSATSSKWYSNGYTPKGNDTQTTRNLVNENDDKSKRNFKDQKKPTQFDEKPKGKSKQQINSNQINDISKKNFGEQSKSHRIDDIPKKKSKELSKSKGFDDIQKKKPEVQSKPNRFDDIPKKKPEEQSKLNTFDDTPKKKAEAQSKSNGFDSTSKHNLANEIDDISKKNPKEPKKSEVQSKPNEFDDTSKQMSKELNFVNEIDDIPKKKPEEQTKSDRFDDIPKKKTEEQPKSYEFDDTPKKISKESNSNENSESQMNSRRRKSYVLAMQADNYVDIDINEPPKEEHRTSYVSKILSKFEDQHSTNIKQEVKSDVDKLFKNYHRKAKITGENREKLSLEINDVLLEKYKQLKCSTDDEQLASSTSKTESPTSPEENDEGEYITLVYNEDDGKLTKYSEEECRNMETKYMITVNETLDPDDSTKIKEQKIEEIKVIHNGSTLDLNANENKSEVRELCDKIQEQLNNVIKTIEIEEISIMGGKTAEEEGKENLFEFWEIQNISLDSIETKSKPDEIKSPDMGYDTEEEKPNETSHVQHLDEAPENMNNNAEIVKEDEPNITNQRRSSYLFSSVSTNSDVSDDKPRSSRLYSSSFRRSQQANEETKNKVETRNSFLSSLRLSFKSNCDEDDKRKRRSFRSSLFGDKKEENKGDGKRNSYISRRKSSVASCSSNKNEFPETPESKETSTIYNFCSSCAHDEISQITNTFDSSDALNTTQKPATNEASSKVKEFVEPILHERRSSYLSNISKTQKKYEDISDANEMLQKPSYYFDSNKEERQINFPTTSLEKSSAETSNKEDPLVKQETLRASRLYSAKFQYNSRSTVEKKDDNNNNCKASKKKTKETVLQFESDNEDEIVEICNPYFSDNSKDAYTKEWVLNTVEHLALQNVKEPEPIEEKEFSSQLRLKTCTVYDEQNNPAIRLSCYDMDKFDDEFEDEQKKINLSEKQYRESIEDIQNNSQLSCLIAELKTTEQSYVKKSLRRLVEDYMPEMNKPDLPLNLVGKVRTIFGNADILYENHRSKFLPDLEASYSVDDIAKCFLKYEEKIFKYYPLYTKNKPKSELLMRDYADFFKRKQDVLEDRLDLSSYLLTPIQRMAKYCQLVKSMVKECEKEGKSSEKLIKTSEMLAKLMSKGNDLIALDSILNFDGDIRQEGDLLLRDTFYVQAPNRRQSYEGMIFLFQESILITQITRYNGFEFFDYQDSIKVCDMGYTDNQAEPLVFKIWYRKRDQKNYVIRANKKEKQQKWVKEIFNLLWKQLEANKMRKKKEYEESGLNEIKLLLPRPTSEPNNKHMFKSRSNSTMKKKTASETIWYSSFMKKFDFNDS